QLEKILHWLRRYKVKGIGIHGIVGIGKTTILLNLNNHEQVAKMFDIVIWLTVSKEGSKENQTRGHLQQAVAQRLKLTMAGTSDADEIAQRIFTELEGIKYLLLLDDVKEYLNLNEIWIPFHNNGNKIVLTTRLRHVCNNKMVDKAIKVEYLSRGESWKMFQDVLGSKKLIKDERIGPLAYQVCIECSGLALLIEKVANTFKLKTTESIWSDGLNSWRMWPSQECEGIKEVALYPEDSNINIDSLLERWEADDLLGIDSDVRKVCVVIGDLVLSHLKNVSLLEEGKSDYHVTMHKFIRRVALYVLEGYPKCEHLVETNKALRERPDEECWREKKRISLGDNELDRLPNSMNCSMLSTLFLQNNLGLKNGNIPPGFFEHMKTLRVLDLSHTGITSLPSSLSFLTALKVLDLNNCEQLVELPSHIGELVHLESLDIHGSGITNLPPHIENLIFLKRLWISFGHGNDTRDVSFNYDMISKLSRLEELVIDVKSPQQLTNEVVENIMNEVATLQEFKGFRVCFPNMIVTGFSSSRYITRTATGTVRIRVPEARILLINHKDIKQLSDFGTTNMKQIRGCLVESCDAIETIMDTVGSELLPNLEQLFIKNQPLLETIWKEGPVQPGSVSKLTTLVISNCPLLDKVFPLGAIEHLCEIGNLTIEKCDNVEDIFTEADAVGNLSVLPKLKELILLDMAKLSSIWREGPLQPGSLTKLTTLILSGYRILVKVFPPGAILQLREIRYLKIEKCDEVEDIIPEADAVGNLSVLPKLEELILLDMAILSSICAIESLEWPSLEKLEIFGCPSLCRLPFNKGFYGYLFEAAGQNSHGDDQFNEEYVDPPVPPRHSFWQ
ncbi:hypothetical protein C3L33_21303, partial [Rhododendron williamsianum]